MQILINSCDRIRQVLVAMPCALEHEGLLMLHMSTARCLYVDLHIANA